MYEYRATLVSVVDGDTVRFLVDLGCDVHIGMTVRVLGVNAPEMSTDAGKRAKVWAQQWFSGRPIVTLNTVKDKREKYGRYLATITAPDGAVFNSDLVAAGMAVPYNP